MDAIQIIWDLPDEPAGNVRHIQQHGITIDEVDEILRSPTSEDAVNRGSDLNITFGWTVDRRYLAVVWEGIDADPVAIYPVTAYEAPPPRAEASRN